MKQVVFLILLCAPMVAHAQAVKRIYLANDDHTDYMWTGNEAQYDSAFVKMLDHYMESIDSTRNHPDDFQTRFNCDGSYWLKTYRRLRSGQQFSKLISHIRSGHISSPLNMVVSTYGAQPTEAVLRGMYYAGTLEREFDLRFPLAVCMENQTLPLGLSSLWAGSGAAYSWRGVCQCATKMMGKLSARRHPLYHYAGLDHKSVLMKWYDRGPTSVDLGGYAEARSEKIITDPTNDIISRVGVLDQLCDTTSQHAHYPYNVAGAFGYGWDNLDTYVARAFATAARATSTPKRRVRVSNEIDFFRDVEQHYKNIPSQSVTFGNEWDLYCATMNETTAEVRRATVKLRTAEALSTLVSLKVPDFGKELTQAKDQAWEGFGFYWEHDWTADGPIARDERATWQIKQKNKITAYVDSLYANASHGLARLIPKGKTSRFYVFNSLGFVRTDVADVVYNGPFPVRVVDVTSQKEVVSQRMTVNGKTVIRVLAENIPAVGYKVFEVIPGEPYNVKTSVRYASGVLQNAFYKIRMHPSGVISEIIDLKAGNRQLVKKEHGRLLNDLGTANIDAGTLSVESEGTVSITIKAISPDPIAHTVRLTLYSDSPRIDIENEINANFGDVKTWSFSFNLTHQTTRFEELGAMLTARKQDRGGHYASENARYDWQTFNHFADLSDGHYGVTLSNRDCSFFALGQSTPDSLWENSPQLNALAGGQVDAPLGIYNQHGATQFHYAFALWPHQNAFDPTASMKFSLQHQNPLIANFITGQNAVYPEKQFSLLNISDSNVLLWAIKPSEEGIARGVVLRLWNLNETNAQIRLSTTPSLRSVWQTSHIETDMQQLKNGKRSFAPMLGGRSLNTYRLAYSIP